MVALLLLSWNAWRAVLPTSLQVFALLLLTWLLLRRSPLPFPTLRLILEVSLLNLSALILAPIVPIGFSIHFALRFLVDSVIRWRTGGKVWLMPGSDAVWGTESYANACNFTSLYVVQGVCDLDKIRNKIRFGIIERVVGGEKVYEKLKWLAGRRLGYSVWERVDDFDIRNHVRVLRPASSESGVFQELTKFYDHPLPTDKPQWETLVIPNYSYDDPAKGSLPHYALIFRIHHSIMDGVSAGFLLQTVLADSPPRLTVDPLAPLPISRLHKGLGYLFMIVFGLHEAVSSFTLREKNSFHGPPLTGPKHLDWSRQISLAALKGMKNATKSSTTAVLVSAMGAALSRLAEKKNFPVPPLIHSATTVAILPYPDMKPQNRFTVVLLPMELGLGTTRARIGSTHKAAQALARSSGPWVNFFFMRLLGQTPAPFCELFMKLCHATMLMSNVPGPSHSVSLFGGDPLVDVAFWTPLRNTIGVSMSMFSYAGQLRVAMVGDSAVLREERDVSDLVKEFEKEILATAKLSGIDPHLCFTTT